MDSLTRTAFFREVVKLSSVAVGGQQYEEMNTPRWKQVAKDAPAVVLGSAVGYGIGKVIAEELGERAARQAMQQGAAAGILLSAVKFASPKAVDSDSILRVLVGIEFASLS